jgi:hypothetical protein
MTPRGLISWVLAASAFAAGCSEPPSPDAGGTARGLEPPHAGVIRVISTVATPLAAIGPADRPTGPGAETEVQTAAGRFVATVSTARAGPESTVSRIVLRARSPSSDRLLFERVVEKEVVNLFDLAWAPDGSAIALCEGTLVSVVGWAGDPQVLYAGPGGPYPGACAGLAWSEDGRRLQFVQFEHAADPALANPARVTLTLERDPSASQGGVTP